MKSGADLEAEIRSLEGVGLSELRRLWTARLGPPPKLRSEELLRLMLAWRLQAEPLGGFTPETRRLLTRRGAIAPEGRTLGDGAILRRDW